MSDYQQQRKEKNDFEGYSVNVNGNEQKKNKRRKKLKKKYLARSLSPERETIIFVPKQIGQEIQQKSILIHSDCEKSEKEDKQEKKVAFQEEYEELPEKQTENEDLEQKPKRRKVSFKDEEGEPLEEVYIIPPRQKKNYHHHPQQQKHIKDKPQIQIIYVAKEEKTKKN